MIVILCDGSSKGNPGPASIGVIIWARYKNSNQNIIRPTEIIHEEVGVRTNSEAEWLSLLKGMDWTAHNNPDSEEVYIYSDSQLVVNQANKTWKVKHDNMIPLYARFQSYIEFYVKQFKRLRIYWVPRQLVYLADKAAKEVGQNEREKREN